jgi:hypothetical protein
LCAKASLAFENFWRGIRAEIFSFEDAADFDFRAPVKGRAIRPTGTKKSAPFGLADPKNRNGEAC